MYIDYIKVYVMYVYIGFIKLYEREVETLIEDVRIYYQDIGMDLGIDKYAMLIMKKKTEVKELTNQENKRTLQEKGKYSTKKYWKLTPSNEQRWKKN